MSKETIKTDIAKEIKIQLDKKTFADKIEKIVKDRLKDNKELEKSVETITKNVIANVFKTLWMKRNFWVD